MILLRPHHALCIRHFEGKGYSGEFTEHMKKTIGRLLLPDAQIMLVKKEDEICRKCPNFLKTGCSSKEKVCAYDGAVLQKIGLAEGTVISYQTLQSRVGECIIDAGSMREICSDCIWADICHQ